MITCFNSFLLGSNPLSIPTSNIVMEEPFADLCLKDIKMYTSVDNNPCSPKYIGRVKQKLKYLEGCGLKLTLLKFKTKMYICQSKANLNMKI